MSQRIASLGVEQEVEKALEREGEESQTVLFPVRIAAAFDAGAGWASFLKNIRAIGDFSTWEDDDTYQKAFERLLRDLQAGP